MKRPLFLLALVPFALWGALALPDLLAAEQSGPWFWRRNLILLSGILALWWMSAGMLLASRPRWLEDRFGGLDKLYRLHKDIGIGAGLLVLIHWQLEWLPKNLAKVGLIAGPNRPRGPRGTPDMWLDLAKEVGEWAGYILLALVVIALLRRIPYRWFRLVHKAFGLVFLAGVFHGLLLMPKEFWQTPLAWVTAAVAALGVGPALLSVSGRIGARRKFPAVVEQIERHADGVLEIVCRPQTAWPGHRAGQFLFADFGNAGEGAHPFTIASAWQPTRGTLKLAIKSLGDFTTTLPGHLEIGQPLTLEGPYGAFDFAAKDTVNRSPQVWIAGGIGITPFLARLDELAAASGTRAPTELFYCAQTAGEFPDRLAERCAAAGVRLHHRLTDRDGPLDPSEVEASLAPGTSVWFCGPAAWGDALARRLAAHGLPAGAFHRELFEFR